MQQFKVGLVIGMATVLALIMSPALASPDPALFGQHKSIYDGALSPSGQKIALLQSIEGQYVVNIVDLNDLNGKLRLIRLGEGIKPKYLKWANEDRVLAAIRKTDLIAGDLIASSFLYSIDVKRMKAEVLIKPVRGFRQFNDRVVNWLEDDPNHIIMQYATDGKDQMFPDVWKVNVRSGRSSRIKGKQAQINSWVSDAAGVPRVGYGSRRRGEVAYMMILSPTTGHWETYDKFPGIDPETMGVVSVSRDGRSMIVSAYRGKNTLGLHKYDLVAKQFGDVVYENDKYDVGDVIMSKDGDTIVGVSFTGEDRERILFDEYNSTFEEVLAKLDGFQVDFIDQSADARRLLIRLGAPDDPGGVYIYERGGKLQPIMENMPGLSVKDMGAVIPIRYSTRDGQKIPAFVTLPPTIRDTAALRNLPFIVLPHGGPYARDSKRFDYFAQFFASRGYGVLQMNFRGSEGYGRSFSEAGREDWSVMLQDVEDGMGYLLEKGYADPDKSCIAGWSFGGYAALMGVAKAPDLYKCAVAVAALTDIAAAAQDLRGYVNGKAMAERTFGKLLDDSALLAANNPVDQADKITVPVFLAHGEEDLNVEFDQFERMKKRLESARVEATYMTFEDEDHFMSTQINRQAMLEGIAAFLDTVNGPSPHRAAP